MVIENNDIPQPGRLRRASIEDIPEIQKLMNGDVEAIFGEISLGHIIELSVLSICQLDEHEAVVGFLALTDHPNMPAIHPSVWEEWLWYFYKKTEMNARNTLFLHAACWQPNNTARFVLPQSLKTVFEHDAHLQHIALMMPPGFVTLSNPVDNLVLQSLFQRVPMQVKGLNSSNLQFMYVARRGDVCPRMQIRKAVEEDNDDLIPILDRQCSRLKELYGEFYISELIARHPESDRVLLVAEHDELAAGVMCLNTAVDFEFLNRHYNLAPFWGLRKISDEDISAQSGLQVYASGPHGSIVTFEQVYRRANSLSTILGTSGPSPNDSSESDLRPQESSNFLDVSPLLRTLAYDLRDKESLQFDIVNIEKHLLEVPKFLSYDQFGSTLKHCDHTYDVLQIKQPHSNRDFHQRPVIPDNMNWKTYRGPPNAFMIELFAMREDIDERHGFDILEVAFELFPTLDYCIISIPTECTVPLFLKHFSLVCPRANNCVPHSLYVVHRNSIDGLVRVRPLEEADWPSVEKLTSDLRALSAMRNCYPNSYVLLSRNAVIGFAILESTKEPQYLRARYLLSEYRIFKYYEGGGLQAGHGTIMVLLMSPAFQAHAKFFVRELLRHSGLTALYWTSIMENKPDGLVGKKLMSIVGEMVPIRPKRGIKYDMHKMLQSNQHLELINKNLLPLSLWLTTARLSSLPKVHINRRIVVVGASCTGLSFLETLLFGQASSYLTFTNVTLVSTHGLPVVGECLRAADIMCPDKGRYDDRQIKSLPFKYYLDVVQDVMVRIQRTKQYIVVSRGGRVYYDDLVLTCGVQYQMPDYMKFLREAEEQSAVSAGCAHTLFDVPRKAHNVTKPTAPPQNVFLVNAIADANRCLLALALLMTGDQYTVMVYGATAAAYCCVSALLEFGLPASSILFVEPFPSEYKHAQRVNFFNNEYVDVTVNRTLISLGVRVYRRHYLHSWHVDASGRLVTVRLLSHYRELDVPCKALFYYGTRGVDLHAFTAVNNSGLVYDGGVAVNAHFATNDPRVVAAGTCTRPLRALRNHNSEDIGCMLAEIVLKRLDPFVGKSKADITSNSENISQSTNSTITSQTSANKIVEHVESLLDSLSMPLVTCCTLPGSLHYLRVRAPGPELPIEVVCAVDAHTHASAQGTVLETWKGGYFSLRVSSRGLVCDITCLRRADNNELHGLIVLYNKHERLLGGLIARFEANMIDDLFDYFSQPWMYALFHEKFDEMLQDVGREEITEDNLQKVVPKMLMDWLGAHGESLSLYAGRRLAADYRYI